VLTKTGKGPTAFTAELVSLKMELLHSLASGHVSFSN
jgi:hypothetical protein